MTTFLKQSTAIDVSVGPFLDETDGKTQETGLTITQPDIRLKKNGGAWAQKNAAQTLSHEENGWYEISLDATDTNTLGNLLIAVHEAGALPVWREFQVLPAASYDALIGGSGNGIRADVQAIAAGAITAAAIGTGAIDADALAADTITAAKIAADAITAAKIATGAITAAKFAAGAIDAAAIATDAIDADSLKADAATEIATAVGAPSAAAIRAEMDSNSTKLANLDATVSSRATPTNVDDAETAILAAVDAVPTAAETADAVWDEALAGHLSAGSTGEALDGAGGGGTPPTAAEIADEVWAKDVSAVAEPSAGFDLVTARASAAAASTSAGQAYASAGVVRKTSTMTSVGTSTQLNDTTLTEVDGYWVGNRVRFIGTDNAALFRYISGSGAGFLTMTPPLPHPLPSGHAYQIFAGPGVAPGEAPTADDNADALLDRASAVDGYTVRELLRVVGAALAGKSSGGASDDVVRAVNDSKDRITVTVDANGHRTAVVVDAT